MFKRYKNFNVYVGRQKHRTYYTEYLKNHPFSVETFSRLVDHIKDTFSENDEAKVLEKRYF
ncbi:Bpu10I family restriction endonuclease [Methanosarcina sp.]|uniref:Bpu10I family restriction endonuclease n=1 Tax=Methanosarcina sp. TaxID=2213 RepID=UPI00399BFB30